MKYMLSPTAAVLLTASSVPSASAQRAGQVRDGLSQSSLVMIHSGSSGVTTMRKHISGFGVAALMVFASIVFIASQRTGYGQSATPFDPPPTVQCQPFQQNVTFDISSGAVLSFGTFRVGNRTRITIEQVSLRIDAISLAVLPTVAALVTTVGPTTSTYYVPIPVDAWLVTPSRPLVLMQNALFHADAGTTVTLSVMVDPRYTSGSGRAQWSVSGQSCTG